MLCLGSCQNACEPKINVIYLHPKLPGITIMHLSQTQTLPCVHCTDHFLIIILSFCPKRFASGANLATANLT